MRSRQSSRSPFGQLLLEYRTRVGQTQEDLGRNVQPSPLSTRSIAGYEAAKSTPDQFRLPHVSNLQSISKALQLSPAQHMALVDAYELTQARKRANPTNSATPNFITAGREEQIEHVRNAWNQARQGRSRVVFIAGDSGIGKSSLAQFICDEIAASTPEVLVSWGEASPWSTEVEPYLALRRALDRMLIPPSEASSTPGRYDSRPRIDPHLVGNILHNAAALSGVLVSEDALDAFVKEYAGTSSLGSEAVPTVVTTSNAQGRLTAFTNFLAGFASQCPVVLVLDDVHWAGRATTDLLAQFTHDLKRQSNLPILIIATYRHHELLPDTYGGEHHLLQTVKELATLDHVSSIELQSTTKPEAGTRFVREALLNAAADVSDIDNAADGIYRRTSGHPLFTMELIRFLLEQENRPGDAPVIDGQSLPKSLPRATHVISDRLNRVSSQNLRILTIASVMGDTILPEPLAEIADLPLTTVLDAIDDDLIARHGLLRVSERAPGVNDALVTYSFAHAMYGEYLYERLPQHRRKRLHQQIAELLESSHARTNLNAMMLADEHYVKAEDWHAAAETTHRIATLWTARMDWDLSRAAFDRAERYALRLQDAARLWMIRADRLSMMRSTGEYDAAIALGERIFEQTQYTDWPHIRALTHLHLGEVYYDLGNLEIAHFHFNESAEANVALGNWSNAGAAEAMLCHTGMRQGQYDAAIGHALKALEYTRSITESWVRPEALLGLANCLTETGQYEAALARYEEAAEYARIMGKLANQVIPELNRGLCQFELGRFTEALETLSRVMELIETQNWTRYHGPAFLYLGYAHEGLGNDTEATAAYTRSEQVRLSHPGNPTLCDSRAGLLRMAMKRGDTAAVTSLLDAIEDFIEEYGHDGIEHISRVLVTCAHARALLGDSAGHERHLSLAHALLLQRTSRMQDVEMRQSFLENVPINAQLRREFEALTTQKHPGRSQATRVNSPSN